MSTLNRVFLMGHLTRDPEVRYTPSQTAVGTLGMAINEKYKNKAGETVEKTVFVDVDVWGRQAETCAEYLYKGSPVFVEGSLKLDQWTNQQGEKRSKLAVSATRVQFLGAPKRGAETADAPPQHSTPPPADLERPVADDDDIPF
jgi:single-strand DNA-binding protein